MAEAIAEKVPTFADVARLVAGGDPPSWLATRLERAAIMISGAREIEAAQPGKAEMLKRLSVVRDAARLLAFTLNAPNSPVLSMLEHAGPGYLEAPGRLAGALNDLADRAVRAAAPLSESNGKARAGRGRAWALPDALTAQSLCAGVIAEVWAMTHNNDRPTSQNPSAIKAADSYWRAAGGTVKNGWGDDRTGWRYHFEKAAEPTAANERLRLQRILTYGDEPKPKTVTVPSAFRAIYQRRPTTPDASSADFIENPQKPDEPSENNTT